MLVDLLFPLAPSKITTFGFTCTGASQMVAPQDLQRDHDSAGIRSAPLIVGSSPEPYASITMGAPGEPEEGKFSCSRQIAPFRSKMTSPGANFEELILASDFQGEVSESPLLASLPLEGST